MFCISSYIPFPSILNATALFSSFLPLDYIRNLLDRFPDYKDPSSHPLQQCQADLSIIHI